MELKLENGIVHYHIAGKGIPLLSLGGRTTDYRFMMGLLEPIFQERSGWQRIYMDLPGHGKTQVDETINSHDKVLDFVIDFADKLLDGRSFAIAGQSLGSYIAQGMVYKLPHKIDGCCLISGGDVWWDVQPRTIPVPNPVILEEDSEFAAGIEQGHDWLLNIVAVQSKRGLSKLYNDWLSAGFPLYDGKLWKTIKARGAYSFDISNLAEPFKRPTLFLQGRQDSMDGYEVPWKTISMFPRATLAVLDNAGHLLGWVEQENLVKTLASDWLDRVESAILLRSSR